ncbi:coiled-coil domain-containing protein 125 isoform X2 [Podarcis muralis]
MSEAVSLQNKLVMTSEGEDDDMACGDLGNGLIRRQSDMYEPESFNIHPGMPRRGSARKSFSPFMLPKKGEECDATVFRCSRCNSLNDTSVKKMGINAFRSCNRQNSSETNSEASNEELIQHLQEAEEAVLDKATCHTKAVFKKTEQQKRALEKEINVLQWEIKINQEKFKNTEESWAEKYDRIYCENAALKETLKLKTDEVKTLKSENEFLEQQYLEILAVLDAKQRKIVEENMSLSKSGFTEITGLELAVLGACTCSGPEGEPCSCAKMSAATRKQLLQLKKEFELLKKSKEEAYIMADAFRIAFEQQLMRRRDQALGLAQMNKICRKDKKRFNWKNIKDDGAFTFQGNRKSLGRKLMGMLASGADSKKIEELDNPQEIIRMLIDSLNDKEEALAHQRKVSYMLARALEEKEDSLQQNKESRFSEELALSSNQCKDDSQPPKSALPVCSSCQTCGAQDCSCSISHTSPTRMLNCTSKSSCSPTPEENYVHSTEEAADQN